MAEHNSTMTSADTHEMGAHERDYSRFLQMMKWGAIASFLIGFIVVVFVL